VFTPKKGLSPDVVREISAIKNEPEWMTKFRLRALEIFDRKAMPNWGGDLTEMDFQDIYYYIRASDRQGRSWDEVPDDIKNTFDRLGIPEAERKFLAGVSAQYESEVVYHSIREDLSKQGVIFCDTDTALREHEDIFKEHWATVIPPGDNKFAALNSAVWSGGSFIWVPPGVRVEIPLQAYFRINQENMGQFERTLIICEEDSFVHYVEGCTAPVYSSDSLHSAVVEIICKKGSRCRYTTIQNWSTNVYNLVTKRAVCHEGATMEWVDGNLGSKLTMKYPAVWMVGPHARGEVLSIAFASEGMHQDAGAKMVHVAPDTSSTIISKSISKGGGRTSYRGLVRVEPGAQRVKANVVCDALLLDEDSRSDTYPYMDIQAEDTSIGHEATVSKVADDQVFYLMSRGLSEEEAMAMIVRGFIEPIAKELPMEYAVELNRLIELQMEGSIG
jgi:Fe-S cluster assembly protein SufB